MKQLKEVGFSYLFLAVLVIAVVVTLADFQRRRTILQESSLEIEYGRSLNSAAKYVMDVELELEKLRLGKGSNQRVELLAGIWRSTGLAREAMSSLPETDRDVSEFMIYMNRIGRFSQETLGKLVKGGELTVDEQILISEFKKGCSEINSILSGAAAMNYSGVEISEVMRGKNIPSLIRADINAMKFEPGGKLEIPLEEGVEIVKHFLQGEDITDIVYRGATDRDIREGIPIHSYDIYIGKSRRPTVWMDLSRDDGYPVMMIKEPKLLAAKESISIEEAIDTGSKFLKHIGFSDMYEVGYEINNNLAIIDYIPRINDTAIYTDAVKLKVSLSDGEIMGFQAVDYLSFHHQRDMTRPKLSENEILELVSDQFKVESIAMAIIEPEDRPGMEAYCYEITGKLENENYKLFMNANNGRQEKIIRVEISKRGA